MSITSSKEVWSTLQEEFQGRKIFDKKIIEKILIFVAHKYNTMVTTIEQTKDLSTLLMTELMGSLEAYKQGMN
ncbi:hypothetical protein CR513_50332, partial [Mucuna pruriens]